MAGGDTFSVDQVEEYKLAVVVDLLCVVLHLVLWKASYPGVSLKVCDTCMAIAVRIHSVPDHHGKSSVFMPVVFGQHGLLIILLAVDEDLRHHVRGISSFDALGANCPSLHEGSPVSIVRLLSPGRNLIPGEPVVTISVCDLTGSVDLLQVDSMVTNHAI